MTHSRILCKLTSAALAAIILLVVAGARLPVASALWIAGPLLLLATVEASVAAGPSGAQANSEQASISRTVLCLLSPGVWLHYAALYALVGLAAANMPQSATPSLVPVPNARPGFMPVSPAPTSHASGIGTASPVSPAGSAITRQPVSLPPSQPVPGAIPQKVQIKPSVQPPAVKVLPVNSSPKATAPSPATVAPPSVSEPAKPAQRPEDK